MTRYLLMACFMFWFSSFSSSAEDVQSDLFETSAGTMRISFLGHGSLLFAFGEKVVYVDPVSEMADYGRLPKADLVLITHEHRDHLDTRVIEEIRKTGTIVVGTETCAKEMQSIRTMRNGDTESILGLRIDAVPAYNLVHMRSPGQPFHPKGVGNGYVITFGDKKVYVAGDTENIPEMAQLKGIDIAFLPMNLPYTMTPEMVADAARSFRPRILYPYHFGKTNTAEIVERLKGEKGIEVRIRDLS